MDIEIKILDGAKLEAKLGAYTIYSDQPKDGGGEGTAPNPFEYFVASVGLCVGHYINAFCKQREITTNNIKIMQKVSRNDQGKVFFLIEVKLPSDFPEKYKDTVLKAAEGCAVKKAIQSQPVFELKMI
jgi:putative redox protein